MTHTHRDERGSWRTARRARGRRLTAPIRRPGALTAFAAVLALATTAQAQGYYSGTKSARAAGRAGAFTAKADDLSAVEYNPAGLARLSGWTLQLGNRFSYNMVSFERASTEDWGNTSGGVPATATFPRVDNARPWQALDPLIGVATDFGLEDWGFALSAYSPPGTARLAFPAGGGQRYMMVERDARILVYAASAAWKWRDLFGVGASLQWVHVPHLEYSLVVDAVPFARQANPVSSTFDMLSTVRGSDPFTFNAILGAWLRPAPFLEVGLSGQVVPSRIRTRSTLDIRPVSLTEDVTLTRDGVPANDVTLTLPLPMTARAGVRYLHERDGRTAFDIELDVVYQTWSRVPDFRLESGDLSASLSGQRVSIGDIVIDKQWRDTVAVLLGGDYEAIPDRLTLRAGVGYESAVARPSHAHVDFASGTHLTGAFGASVLFGSFEFAMSYGYRHQLPVSVSEREGRVYQETPGSLCEAPYTDPNTCHSAYPGQPSPTVNAGHYVAFSHMAGLDLLHRF